MLRADLLSAMTDRPSSRLQLAAAEFGGTAALVCAVVGSGIMGDRLSGGSVGLALLANTLATGAALVVLILTLGPISGAHLNPVVSIVEAARGKLAWRNVPLYVGAQLLGGVVGVALADLMFSEPIFALSTKVREGSEQMLSEATATFGLLIVIVGVTRSRPSATPFAVGAYIMSAYWFTASTSFANPAVTIARALTNTFAGIRYVDVPNFLLAQGVGAIAAVVVGRVLFPQDSEAV